MLASPRFAGVRMPGTQQHTWQCGPICVDQRCPTVAEVVHFQLNPTIDKLHATNITIGVALVWFFNVLLFNAVQRDIAMFSMLMSEVHLDV